MDRKNRINTGKFSTKSHLKQKGVNILFEENYRRILRIKSDGSVREYFYEINVINLKFVLQILKVPR